MPESVRRKLEVPFKHGVAEEFGERIVAKLIYALG
jgi:hypothetical protein